MLYSYNGVLNFCGFFDQMDRGLDAKTIPGITPP